MKINVGEGIFIFLYILVLLGVIAANAIAFLYGY